MFLPEVADALRPSFSTELSGMAGVNSSIIIAAATS